MTQLSLLSGTNTPAKSCENEQQTDGFQICECGKGTLDCSIHPSTPEKWIASMRDSLAKTLALLAIKPDWEKELEAVSTGKSCGLLASFDPDTCSWKTCQQSLVTDSEPYSQTWPRWGMTAGGFAYAHPMSERRITETGGGVWLGTPTASMSERSPEFAKERRITGIGGGDYVPTPTCNMVSGGVNHNSPTVIAGRHGLNLKGYVEMFATPNTLDGMPPKSVEKILAMNHKHRPGRSYAATNLREQVVHGKIQMWPTPTAHNAKETNAPSESNRNTPTLAAEVGGTLNPQFVAWLMAFPIEWTNSKDWVTRSARSKRQLHGDYSEANK